MFIKTPTKGYHFSSEGIARVEEMYKAKYMGYWSIKDKTGNWAGMPVEVFYQPNPDTSKGHSHYFGLYRRDGSVFITDAKSAFSEPIVGILTEDGEVIVSRYGHDFVKKGQYMIDGGRGYTRSSGGQFVKVTVVDGEFQFEEYK